jgi:hypothetical protein
MKPYASGPRFGHALCKRQIIVGCCNGMLEMLLQAWLCHDCISAHIKRIKIDSDAYDLSVPGAAIGTGTNRIPDIKTSVEMESIFVPGQFQISKQPALALVADC